jgi:hypothetical protein
LALALRLGPRGLRQELGWLTAKGPHGPIDGWAGLGVAGELASASSLVRVASGSELERTRGAR